MLFSVAAPSLTGAAAYDDFARGMSANNVSDSDTAISAFTSALATGDLTVARGEVQTVLHQTCEAGFYLAEWSIDHGELASARPRLNGAVAGCPHSFVAYLSTKIELARLN